MKKITKLIRNKEISGQLKGVINSHCIQLLKFNRTVIQNVKLYYSTFIGSMAGLMEKIIKNNKININVLAVI